MAFTLIKRLQSEWLNVVNSNEALENAQGLNLASFQTHLAVISAHPPASAVVTPPYPLFTFWPCTVQPSGRVTRRKRPIVPIWRTSRGLRRGWWGCRMFILCRLQASWGDSSRGWQMAKVLMSTCPQCQCSYLVMTASWLERYMSKVFIIISSDTLIIKTKRKVKIVFILQKNYICILKKNIIRKHAEI